MLTISKELSPDILVTAEQGKPLLVVEVERHPLDSNVLRQIEKYSQAFRAVFIMGVDPQQILIARTRDGLPDWNSAIKLTTSTILSHYADIPDIDRIEDFYLEALITAWLRDFSFSWKSQKPPGFDELSKIGLASRLRHSVMHAQN